MLGLQCQVNVTELERVELLPLDLARPLEDKQAVVLPNRAPVVVGGF